MAKTLRKRLFDAYGYVEWIDVPRTGKRRLIMGGIPRTQFGKEFLFPDQTNDRSTHPYAYSPFFHWKAADWKPTDSANYDDRMRQWDRDKWESLRSKYRFTDFGFSNMSPDSMSKMLSEYFGEQVVCTAVVEGCNVGNGYPYHIFYHRKVAP